MKNYSYLALGLLLAASASSVYAMGGAEDAGGGSGKSALSSSI